MSKALILDGALAIGDAVVHRVANGPGEMVDAAALGGPFARD